MGTIRSVIYFEVGLCPPEHHCCCCVCDLKASFCALLGTLCYHPEAQETMSEETDDAAMGPRDKTLTAESQGQPELHEPLLSSVS